MIKVGIIGATGYAGGELVRIISGHKDAEIKWYGEYVSDCRCSLHGRQHGGAGVPGGCDLYGDAAGAVRISCK